MADLTNLKSLSDEELLALQERTNAAVEGRRKGVSLESIRPGMSADEMTRARDEISRVLKGFGQ